MKYFRTLATVVLLASSSVALQAQDRTLAKANVPFAFTAENVTLPAGTYRVSTLPPYNSIRIKSADGRRSVMIPTIVAQHSQESEQVKLVFQRVGGEYFLTQIWEQGSTNHREVRIGKHALELAKTGGTNQRVTVLAAPGNVPVS